MSIWINRPAVVRRGARRPGTGRTGGRWAGAGLSGAVALLLALAGCVAGGGAAQVRIGPDGPVIAGPTGFCVDAETSRPSRAAPTILLVPCAMLAPDGAAGAGAMVSGPQPILSVTLAAEGAEPPPVEALALWAGTRRGRAALSRAGRAETVTLTDARIEDNVAYLTLSDSARFPGAAVAPDYWRAIFVLRGRVASASVYLPASEDADARAARGAALQAALVASLRAANRP